MRTRDEKMGYLHAWKQCLPKLYSARARTLRFRIRWRTGQLVLHRHDVPLKTRIELTLSPFVIRRRKLWIAAPASSTPVPVRLRSRRSSRACRCARTDQATVLVSRALRTHLVSYPTSSPPKGGSLNELTSLSVANDQCFISSSESLVGVIVQYDRFPVRRGLLHDGGKF